MASTNRVLTTKRQRPTQVRDSRFKKIFVARSKNLTNWGILITSTNSVPNVHKKMQSVHIHYKRCLCKYNYELVKILYINFNPSGFLFGTGCKTLELINLVTKLFVDKEQKKSIKNVTYLNQNGTNWHNCNFNRVSQSESLTGNTHSIGYPHVTLPMS